MSEQSLDQKLVERVQQGDKRAFDLLVQKYQHKVLNLITRYVKNPSEAQDVAQEAFIKAYRALATFRGDSAFYTWLYRIAVNTSKNYLTSQSRRPPASDVDAQDAEFYDGGEVLHETATPEGMALTDEIRQEVFGSIEDLPGELKTAIRLREFEGMSYDEIAEVMECPVGTVRSRIFRAREAIDKRLRPLLEH